jgi:hypothetical protein
LPDPAGGRDVLDLGAAVEHECQAAVADREPKVPAHCPENNLGGKAEASERSGFGHKQCPRNGWREHRSYPFTAALNATDPVLVHIHLQSKDEIIY